MGVVAPGEINVKMHGKTMEKKKKNAQNIYISYINSILYNVSTPTCFSTSALYSGSRSGYVI